MTPAERVAIILHDVFRYSFAEIAEIVGRSPEASRQLASSARRKARSAQPGAAQADEYAAIVKTFKTAWENGDIRALTGILDPHATAIIDGGGLVSAQLQPIHGAGQIARFFLGIAGRQPGLAILEEKINGQPPALAMRPDVIVGLAADMDTIRKRDASRHKHTAVLYDGIERSIRAVVPGPWVDTRCLSVPETVSAVCAIVGW